MTQNERVAIIQELFPGYDAPLDSKCEKPNYYGIQRVPKANALLRKAEQPCYKFTVRLPKTDHKLMFLLKEMGYNSISEWIHECIDDLWRRFYEKKEAAAPTKTSDSPKAYEGD